LLRRLYDWTIALAAGRHAPSALGAVSFVESSFFPIPPDVMLIPMVLAKREAAWRYTVIATLGSVIGGLFGYTIGALLFDQVAQPIIDFYGYTAAFDQFRVAFNHWGVLIVFLFGLTPFPYKVITIASGVTGLNLPLFMLSSLVARGLRFLVVSALLYWFGPAIRDFIEKRLGLVFTVFCVLLVGGFIAIKFLL
jgi:membrane protein YqaA with SNARE-associated domain